MTTATSQCCGDSGSCVSGCYNSRLEKRRLPLVNEEQAQMGMRATGSGLCSGCGAGCPSPRWGPWCRVWAETPSVRR